MKHEVHMSLPALPTAARRFIKATYYDSEVAAMVRNPEAIYRLIYGTAAPAALDDHKTALAHLEGDLADRKKDLAELERARAALLVLIG